MLVLGAMRLDAAGLILLLGLNLSNLGHCSFNVNGGAFYRNETVAAIKMNLSKT